MSSSPRATAFTRSRCERRGRRPSGPPRQPHEETSPSAHVAARVCRRAGAIPQCEPRLHRHADAAERPVSRARSGTTASVGRHAGRADRRRALRRHGAFRRQGSVPWTATKQPWKVENGYVEVVPNAGDLRTKEKFGDVQLHVEWAAPAQVRGDSQNRGNSGIFLQGRYEVQVLDSFDNLDLSRRPGGCDLRSVAAAGNRRATPGRVAVVRHRVRGAALRRVTLTKPATSLCS